MSFLTRVEFDRSRRAGVTLLASPQRMHEAVLSSFTADQLSADGRVLWRVDQSAPTHRLFVVSPSQPDFAGLAKTVNGRWESRDYEPFLARLDAGQRWAFRLRANPSYVQTEAIRGKKIRSHSTPERQLGWFLERVELLGVSVPTAASGQPDVVVRDAGPIRFRHRNNDDPHIRIFAATFDGTLQIEDADLLRTALLSGIGRSKAYGCGLLTLARR